MFEHLDDLLKEILTLLGFVFMIKMVISILPTASKILENLLDKVVKITLFYRKKLMN
ncbi:hypothetical protein KCU_10968 [Pasteurella multocida subsp. multocida str. P52VAC]|nr:hypothetical protein KCU_10968 [Pasteurella multocida subsp. multocida str. P52VAC]